MVQAISIYGRYHKVLSSEEQMKKIYNDILLSIDSTNKKKGVMALASYGKKAIPLIQELRNMETNEDLKNYMFDAITKIDKGLT